jgi:hypothetical protein
MRHANCTVTRDRPSHYISLLEELPNRASLLHSVCYIIVGWLSLDGIVLGGAERKTVLQ